jgi:oligopeptide transport system permease protein
MTRYALGRIGQAMFVIVASTLLLYFLAYAMPGDPVAALAGEGSRQLDEATRAAIRARYNLDQPFIVQYWRYLTSAVTGDLGNTFSGRPVTDILASAMPVTFRLAVITIRLQAVVGIAVGVLVGKRRGGVLDGTVMTVTMVLIGVPTFVAGYLIQHFFGVKAGWFKPTVSAAATWRELVVPGTVLALGSMAFLIRFTRSAIAETSAADHVRQARANGLAGWKINLVHILRNALIPIVTVLGTEFGSLLGGAILTESIFNVPGFGQQVYQSIIRGAVAPTVSLVTVLVVIFVLVNLAVDLLYAVLNPKVRYDAHT